MTPDFAELAASVGGPYVSGTSQKKVISAEARAFKVGSPPSRQNRGDRFESIRKIRDQNHQNFYLKAERFDPVDHSFECQKTRVHNFGSCSYLGLEYDERLKKGAIDAINEYGVQFSSAAMFLSVNLYADLEALYQEIFGHPVVLFSSTTLAHLSTLPIVVGPNDLVLIDQLAHRSLQFAVQYLSGTGIKTKTIPTNAISLLKNILSKYGDQYEKVWFCTDSIYSMNGAVADLEELKLIQAEFSNFYLYVDDAHGMSWAGKNGCGYAMSILGKLDRAIVVVSNSKCFAGCGGTVIFSEEMMRWDVKSFGPTMTFSGPIQPPMMGAAYASAKIHLGPDILLFQEKLRQLISFRNEVVQQYELPVKCILDTPIMLVVVGSNVRAGLVQKEMLSKGFYANPALYPSVPIKENGIRFTTTLLQDEAQIEAFCVALKECLDSIPESVHFG
jgi:7-keto-8-aminopelargonate synthetase-like enzyme